MAGIYIHIPFCKQACHYCDFHFSTVLKHKEKVLNSMLTELDLRKNYCQEKIETIYFGGGTPSILCKEELKAFFDVVYVKYDVAQNAEITVECNPDDLTEEKLKELKGLGVNRLSIGLQSFQNENLTLMNRVHNAQESLKCVGLATEIGFDNITIDLIYGMPNQTLEDWQKELEIAVELGVDHISSYCLTVEEKTPLHKMINQGKIIPIKDEVSSTQFELMVSYLAQHGYEQYEISNFAKPGCYSKHNTAYWKQKKYVGIGPGAHSFNGISRQWNISNNHKYASLISDNKTYFELENIATKDAYNEYMLTGLRTKRGVNLHYIVTNFGLEYKEYFLKEAEPYESTLKITNLNRNYTLTQSGKLMADAIASDMFWV